MLPSIFKLSTNSNVNKAFTQGVEIQGSWSPIKKLTFNGGYQLLYAKDLEAIEDFKSGSVFARDKITKQSFELKPKDYFVADLEKILTQI